MTLLSCSRDFALYFEDYFIDEYDTWDIGSVWYHNWHFNKCRSPWPQSIVDLFSWPPPLFRQFSTCEDLPKKIMIWLCCMVLNLRPMNNQYIPPRHKLNALLPTICQHSRLFCGFLKKIKKIMGESSSASQEIFNLNGRKKLGFLKKSEIFSRQWNNSFSLGCTNYHISTVVRACGKPGLHRGTEGGGSAQLSFSNPNSFKGR